MRHFYTLRCPAPFWLILCTPYRNRFIIAKVIDRSLGARYLWPTVYMDMDISMDIHAKSVDMDMDMDMDGKFHIHGNPVYLATLFVTMRRL